MFVKTREAAELLGVNESMFRVWVRKKLVPKIELAEWKKLQMVDFKLECIFLSFKVCLGVLLITGMVILVVAPINYLTQAAKDRLEDWDFKH